MIDARSSSAVRAPSAIAASSAAISELRREHEELLRLRHVEERGPERLQRPRDADRPRRDCDLGVGVAEILEHRAGDPDHDRERNALREVRRRHPPARRRGLLWIAFRNLLWSTRRLASASRRVPEVPRRECLSRGDEHEGRLQSTDRGYRACWVAHSSAVLVLLCLLLLLRVLRGWRVEAVPDRVDSVCDGERPEPIEEPAEPPTRPDASGTRLRLRHRSASAWVGRSSTSGTPATRPRFAS